MSDNNIIDEQENVVPDLVMDPGYRQVTEPPSQTIDFGFGPYRFPISPPPPSIPNEELGFVDPDVIMTLAAEIDNAPVEPLDSLDSDDPAYKAALSKTVTRPDEWDDIIGNARAKETIREVVSAANKDGRPADHILLFGPPGVGKTTLAKMVAKDMKGVFVETTASSLTTHADMIRSLHVMNEGRKRTLSPSTMFIDEIHGLGKRGMKQEAIYPLLEDFKFFHNLQGKKLEMSGNGGDFIMTETSFRTWPFTCVGATTEPGVLSAPLLRRFLIQIEMEPYTDTDIGEIILRASRRRETPITETAAERLAAYCRRNPGRAFSLMAHARNRMSTLGADAVTDDVVAEIVERLQLYPQGLTETDVRALQVLAARMPRGVGQAELSKALGISLLTYSNNMEPYLRQLGFVQTLNRRVLTSRGLQYLQAIDRADLNRAELRAILSKIKN